MIAHTGSNPFLIREDGYPVLTSTPFENLPETEGDAVTGPTPRSETTEWRDQEVEHAARIDHAREVVRRLRELQT